MLQLDPTTPSARSYGFAAQGPAQLLPLRKPLRYEELLANSPSTGAASGFGLATVRKFIEEGAKVVAADMNEQGLQKAYADAADTHVALVTANVTSSSDWQKMVDLAVSKFGGLDILVNNAGTSYKNKPTLEVTEDEYDRVFAVNVKSIFLSVAAAIPALKNRGGGAIINVASIGAMRPRPGLVWYNASKGAVANVRSVDASCPFQAPEY
jgi:NAD(P)-dependent dehydrogenase (short-subunit alcohol dehydrogenase family)